MQDKDTENIVHFIFEMGHLKNTPRAGWPLLGIPNPESVADHTSQAVFIAYILAKLEGANPDRTALIVAFHEMAETRIGDLHKMAQSYILDKKAIEIRIVGEQSALLPADIGKDFVEFFSGFDTEASIEHTIAKDADYLQVIFQGKFYVEQGYVGAQNWIDNATKCLVTKSAKDLAAQVAKTRSTQWYEGIKRIKR